MHSFRVVWATFCALFVYHILLMLGRVGTRYCVLLQFMHIVTASSLGCHGAIAHPYSSPSSHWIYSFSFSESKPGYINLGQQYPGSQLLLDLLDLFLHFLWILVQVLISVMKGSFAGHLQQEAGRQWSVEQAPTLSCLFHLSLIFPISHSSFFHSHLLTRSQTQHLIKRK